MSTLLEVKTAAAHYLDKGVADLTVNSQDLGLLALNQARKMAELQHDFEFSRKLVSLSVNGVTGGALSDAVLYGTETDVDIKTVLEVGLFDEDANLRPVEWTTVAEGLERQRKDNPYTQPRYPTDGWHKSGPIGEGRFVFTGDTVYRFPKDSDNDFTLGMEVYAFTTDWVSGDLSAAQAPWTTKGEEYLMWATVFRLNHLFKAFVPRQEGNLPPPTGVMEAALEAFKLWDTFRFEQFRRHSR